MKTLQRLTALGAVLVGTSLMAQESVGTIVGIVRDANGAPIAGAHLDLTGPKLVGQRAATTNERGEYRMPLVLPGEYQLSVRKEGYIGSKSEFRLGAGQTLRQEFGLKAIATAGTQVEVVAAFAAGVDKTETKTSTNISAETLQALPTGSLNSYGALYTAPGVVGSTQYPVVRGGLTGETQFTVNGISVRDSVVRQGRQFEVVIDDLIEDISVIQSPLNAKYGNASGGIVNAVTKTGGNDFSGSLRVKLSKGSWGALSGPVIGRGGATWLSNGSVQSDDLSKTYEYTITGPIIKDVLTFTYAGRINPVTYPVATSTNIVDLGRNYLPGLGATAWTYGASSGNPMVGTGPRKSSTNQYKLFWLPAQGHQVEVFYTDDKLGPYFDTQYGNLDQANQSLAASNQSSERPFYGINYRGIFGSNSILDVKYGKKRSAVHFSSGPLDPVTVRVWTNAATSFFSTTGSWGTYATNGDYLSPAAEVRQAETASANFNWFSGAHNVDVGVEMLKETAFLPEQSGPNRRVFYMPGRDLTGNYVVYNYVGSTAQTMTSATLRNSNAYIPEMRTYQDGGSGDTQNYDTTWSIYANDLWTLSNHWSVMGGLRFDRWEDKDRAGTNIKSNAVSPRLEVKYDIQGNNVHLLNLSYGEFRGTIGQGNLGGLFAHRPGNQIARRFWSVGSTLPAATATLADITNPANYGYVYTVQDADALYTVNHGLKPENTHEIQLGYRRNFGNGGFFRSTLVYRWFTDLWYRTGFDAVVTIPDFTGQAATVPTGYLSKLDTDPQGKRRFRSLETEWKYPIVRGTSFTLDYAGNWTFSRLYSTETWREGNVASSGTRFIDKYNAFGISQDSYNPYGPLEYLSTANVVKGWLSAAITSKRGIKNEVTLMGSYTSGAPYSMAMTQSLPAGYFTSGATGLPTTMPEYLNGRGRFTSPDYFQCDLQWNVTVPLKGKLQFFTYVSMYNIFNTIMPNGAYNYAGVYRDSSTAIRPYPDTNPTLQVGTPSGFGLPNSLSGRRSFGIDMGIKF
ncbi:TonB-dependent receptor [Geothrix oryzisoli]|uniref:TonB-dependent receptor n=1 Tax=Geothrix oryzisoli TaxID=2922721 RepID=UPI001FAD64B9|nr:TonB-dependent receptor [Geothrix oryzisoli]